MTDKQTPTCLPLTAVWKKNVMAQNAGLSDQSMKKTRVFSHAGSHLKMTLLGQMLHSDKPAA